MNKKSASIYMIAGIVGAIISVSMILIFVGGSLYFTKYAGSATVSTITSLRARVASVLWDPDDGIGDFQFLKQFKRTVFNYVMNKLYVPVPSVEGFSFEPLISEYKNVEEEILNEEGDKIKVMVSQNSGVLQIAGDILTTWNAFHGNKDYDMLYETPENKIDNPFLFSMFSFYLKGEPIRFSDIITNASKLNGGNINLVVKTTDGLTLFNNLNNIYGNVSIDFYLTQGNSDDENYYNRYRFFYGYFDYGPKWCGIHENKMNESADVEEYGAYFYCNKIDDKEFGFNSSRNYLPQIYKKFRLLKGLNFIYYVSESSNVGGTVEFVSDPYNDKSINHKGKDAVLVGINLPENLEFKSACLPIPMIDVKDEDGNFGSIPEELETRLCGAPKDSSLTLKTGNSKYNNDLTFNDRNIDDYSPPINDMSLDSLINQGFIDLSDSDYKWNYYALCHMPNDAYDTNEFPNYCYPPHENYYCQYHDCSNDECNKCKDSSNNDLTSTKYEKNFFYIEIPNKYKPSENSITTLKLTWREGIRYYKYDESFIDESNNGYTKIEVVGCIKDNVWYTKDENNNLVKHECTISRPCDNSPCSKNYFFYDSEGNERHCEFGEDPCWDYEGRKTDVLNFYELVKGTSEKIEKENEWSEKSIWKCDVSKEHAEEAKDVCVRYTYDDEGNPNYWSSDSMVLYSKWKTSYFNFNKPYDAIKIYCLAPKDWSENFEYSTVNGRWRLTSMCEFTDAISLIKLFDKGSIDYSSTNKGSSSFFRPI